MKTARRKSTPHRSPSATIYPINTNESSSSSSQVKVEDKQPSSSFEVHDRAPATFGTPALQSLIYATSNDRYPGAPGTLLHKAKLEAARALASKQREAQREAERREEMKRLGILGMGKKRSTANGNGSTTNGSSRFGTPPTTTNERTRRSNPTNGNGSTATVLNGTSTRPGRGGNGRNVNNAIEHNALPTPSTQQDHKQQQQPNGISSPLLSSSGRLRRPASGSRGTSPMPLTGSSTNGSGMVTRTRSPIVAPLELDDDAKVGSSALGLSSSSANGVLA